MYLDRVAGNNAMARKLSEKNNGILIELFEYAVGSHSLFAELAEYPDAEGIYIATELWECANSSHGLSCLFKDIATLITQRNRSGFIIFVGPEEEIKDFYLQVETYADALRNEA